MFNINDPYHSFLQLQGQQWLGSGSFRDVFTYGPTQVIKVAKLCPHTGLRTKGAFHNQTEKDLWEWVASGDYYKNMRKWLAPCDEMSLNGELLVQERTTQILELPKKLPDWLTDIKPDNFGLYKGRIVCHDYALNLLPNFAAKHSKLRKPPVNGFE